MISLSIASDMWQRMSGLLFRAKLEPGEGLWIQNCRGIHTIGMRYPIGLYFLNQNRRVIRVDSSIQTMRFAWCQHADSVIETLPIDLASLSQSVQEIEALLDTSRRSVSSRCV